MLSPKRVERSDDFRLYRKETNKTEAALAHPYGANEGVAAVGHQTQSS